MSTEQDYLQRWLEVEHPNKKLIKAQKSESNTANHDELLQLAKGLAFKIREAIAGEAYSKINPPISVDDASARRSELANAKELLQAALSEVTAAAGSKQITKRLIQSAKFPLTKILGEIDAEIGVIRSWTKAQHKQGQKQSSQFLLLDAVTRAVNEHGLVLTEDEMIAYARLLERRRN